MIRNIRYQETSGHVFYCHAEEEVPDIFDFKEWIFDNNYGGLLIKGQDHLCYSPRLVKDYLTIVHGFSCVEIAEDYGEAVDPEIIRQAKGLSQLEIMD